MDNFLQNYFSYALNPDFPNNRSAQIKLSVSIIDVNSHRHKSILYQTNYVKIK